MEGKKDDSSGGNIGILRNQWFHLPLDAQLKPRLERSMNKEMLAGTINLLWSSGVCNNPGGEALSSLNDKKQLSYPCVCTKQDGSPDDFSPQSETLGVLKTSALITRPKVYEHCKQEMKCTGEEGNLYRLDCGGRGGIRGENVVKERCEAETFTAWGRSSKHSKVNKWLDGDYE